MEEHDWKTVVLSFCTPETLQTVTIRQGSTLCVRGYICVCVYLFRNLCGDQKLEFYYTCGDQRSLWGQKCLSSWVWRHFWKSKCGFSFRVTVRLSLGSGARESITSSRCLQNDMKTWLCVCVRARTDGRWEQTGSTGRTRTGRTSPQCSLILALRVSQDVWMSACEWWARSNTHTPPCFRLLCIRLSPLTNTHTRAQWCGFLK